MTSVVKIASTKEISHSDWLAIRNNGLGGSDAAVACGLSRWKSPVNLWLEKTGQVEPTDLSDNERVYWGIVLEEVVAREFAKQSGLKIRRCNAVLQSTEYPWMLANIDREIVGMKASLECKTANAFAGDDWAEDNVPDMYFLQCQHYMAVTGYESWYIAVLLGGQKFIWKEIRRDAALITSLIASEQAFWQHVVDKTMPSVDGSSDCAAALQKMYSKSKGTVIPLPDTAEQWVHQYQRACEDSKEADRRKLEAQNALCLALGENEVGTLATCTVSWKSTKSRATFDGKRFSAEHPNLYKQYIKIGEPSRRFSIQRGN